MSKEKLQKLELTWIEILSESQIRQILGFRRLMNFKDLRI